MAVGYEVRERMLNWILGSVLRRGQKQQIDEHLLSPERFEGRLYEERARADRANTPFTCLVFEALRSMDQVDRKKAERLFAGVLTEHTREIDIKGWYGRNVGLILPLTSSVDAEKVWDKLRAEFRKQVIRNFDAALPLPEYKCVLRAHPRMIRDRRSSTVS